MNSPTYFRKYFNYQVFLNGERIGVIGNKNDLYALIDTSKLPTLSNEEKNELFIKIKQRR